MIIEKKEAYKFGIQGCGIEFLDVSGDWELLCGKSNVYRDLFLCPKCEKKFLNKGGLPRKESDSSFNEETKQ